MICSAEAFDGAEKAPDPVSTCELTKLPARRFIKWTQDTFKSGGHKAELLPLLERCTRELQGDARYKKDIRYLRVWIQYVSTTFPPVCACNLYLQLAE